MIVHRSRTTRIAKTDYVMNHYSTIREGARRARLGSLNRYRPLLWQASAVLLLLFVGGWMFANLQQNLTVRNISSGFGFLRREAGLPIAEHLINYRPSDTYLKALVVGTLNTLWVASIGIVLATALGTLIGIARLSRNWLLAKLTAIYVEFFRDLPLLLQLLFCYTLLQGLPGVRSALNPISGVYLSNRGLNLPALIWSPSFAWVILSALASMLFALVFYRNLRGARQSTSKSILLAVIALATPVVVGFATGSSISIDWPVPKGFNIRGGTAITPEFFALLLALVIYNSAFIAEIVRSGLQSVGRGQHEAAYALGLKPAQSLKHVVFPQAMRVVIPPMTSQFLNLTKNSSLAVAVGYQDIVSVSNTAMNQTGQAIELVGVIMTVYLTISLSISLLMNFYNKRMTLVER